MALYCIKFISAVCVNKAQLGKKRTHKLYQKFKLLLNEAFSHENDFLKLYRRYYIRIKKFVKNYKIANFKFHSIFFIF